MKLRTKDVRSFAGCFDTTVYNDVTIADTISKFTVTLTRLESYVALSELKVFVGRATSSFHASNLDQDSSRTWLVFDEPGLTTFEVDELDVRGNAHLAIQNSAGKVVLKVNQYKGDFTGTVHVGGQQELYLNASDNSVIPFTLRTYQVSLDFMELICMFLIFCFFLTILEKLFPLNKTTLTFLLVVGFESVFTI